MNKVLIAECGNNHFGDVDAAKEMIIAAQDAGADLVKFQAIDENCTGSMPGYFYANVQMTTDMYEELIEFGKDISCEVFFSIFTKRHTGLYAKQKYHKVSGSMSRDVSNAVYSGSAVSAKNEMEKILGSDIPLKTAKTFISLPSTHIGLSLEFRNWTPLYVSEYMVSKPDLSPLGYFSQHFGSDKEYGYSDHSLELETVEHAIKDYGCSVVEKHLSLTKNYRWNGIMFRDTVHSATPKEFAQIAKWLKG